MIAMKKLALILAFIILSCSFACACAPNSQTESSASEESDYNPMKPERNEIVEKYTFLKSKYSVTAKCEMHEIKYRYDYYFVNGKVAGLRQTVSLPSPERAREYYTEIVASCPEAIINASTVTYYVGEGANCFGYTLDKLKFQLESQAYEYTVNFSEDDFREEFGGNKAKTVTQQP